MKRIASLAVGMALIVPSSAFAASSSTCQAYNPQTCDAAAIQSVSSPAVATNTVAKTTATQSSGQLPFTGIDVGLLAVGGGALAGFGLMGRRLARKHD